jgi:hypothetical protein
MSSRVAHIVSLLFAVGVIAVIAYWAKAPMTPCTHLPNGYQPVLAFELAQTPADVHAIFDHSATACQAKAQSDFTKINFTDNFVFIPVYTLFIIFFFLGSGDSFLARIGIGLAIIAAIGDWLENYNLGLLAASPNAPSADALLHLHIATSVKWMALGIANFVGGLTLAQRGGFWTSIAFVLCSASLILTGLGLVYSPTFGPQVSNAVGIGWLIFLIADIRGAFRTSRKFS